MVDLIALGQALNAVKALTDVAKTMVALRDAAKLLEATIDFNQQLIEVQKSLLAAQVEQATLIETIRNQEEQIACLKAWEGEKQRYELRTLAAAGASYAYFIKPAAQGAEPFHCICAACYENGKKSILQFTRMASPYKPRQHILKCLSCQATVLAETWPPPGDGPARP